MCVCVYHVLCEDVELGTIEPLGALVAAVQRLAPRHEDGAAHSPRAHSLLGKEGPRLAGLEDKHCVGGMARNASIRSDCKTHTKIKKKKNNKNT